MTTERIQSVLIEAAAEAGRITPVEAEFLRRYLAGTLGEIGEAEAHEAERIVTNMQRQTQPSTR